MKKQIRLSGIAAFGVLSVIVLVPVRQAPAQGNTATVGVPPRVFPAAGRGLR